MIGQFFDTMIVASTDKGGNNDPSKSTSWKVLESVFSYLKPKNVCVGGYLGVQSDPLCMLLVVTSANRLPERAEKIQWAKWAVL